MRKEEYDRLKALHADEDYSDLGIPSSVKHKDQDRTPKTTTPPVRTNDRQVH